MKTLAVRALGRLLPVIGLRLVWPSPHVVAVVSTDGHRAIWLWTLT